jgi:ectoine hydroxylase-related dioxygenase (phytanoyl-CoA dioxygenase family)
MNADFDTVTDASTVQEAQLADYYRKGWVRLSNVVTDSEIATLNPLITEVVERKDFQPKRPSGGGPDQSTEAYRQIMRVYRDLSAEYKEVAALVERFAPFVRDLNGWEHCRVWQDRVFIKPGTASASRPTNWHQDVKVPLDRRGFATVWIAMVDIPKTRGPLTFLNGSHRLGSLGGIEQLKGHVDLSELLTTQDWAVIDGCESGAPLRPGDATVHGMMTLHRAGENRDSEDRVVLAISYFDAEQLYTGQPNEVTDGLGLIPFKEFDHEKFPIVA